MSKDGFQVVEMPQRDSDDVSLVNDSWLGKRRGRITGTKYSGSIEGSRKNQLTGEKYPNGFYQLVGESVSDERPPLKPYEIGLVYENENIEIALKKLGFSDEESSRSLVWINGDFMLSPDCSENSQKPSWIIEGKSFDCWKHLWLVSRLAMAVDMEEIKSIIPKDNYDQIIHGFFVNDNLKNHYWSLYCPELKDDYKMLRHFMVKIERKDVENEIQEHGEKARRAMALVKERIDNLKKLNDSIRGGKISKDLLDINPIKVMEEIEVQRGESSDGVF